MAKRFTDTGKWDKAWFRKLTPELKCAWNFLCDRCDHAGVWEVDLDALQFFVGIPFTLANLTNAFGDRLVMAGNKILIQDFAEFQYGSLNPDNRVHKSVLDRLQKLALKKDLKRTLKGTKDTDTDKDTDNSSLEKGSGGKPFKPDLNSIYKLYPRKEGKSKGLSILSGSIKTPADLDDAFKAMAAFLAHHKKQGTAADFFPHFKTWAGAWRDWLDPDHGSSEDFSAGAGIDWSKFKEPEGAA